MENFRPESLHFPLLFCIFAFRLNSIISQCEKIVLLPDKVCGGRHKILSRLPQSVAPPAARSFCARQKPAKYLFVPCNKALLYEYSAAKIQHLLSVPPCCCAAMSQWGATGGIPKKRRGGYRQPRTLFSFFFSISISFSISSARTYNCA